MKIVYINWKNAETQQGWEENEETESLAELGNCHTVGFLVGESDDFLVVASTVSTSQNTCRIIIPTGMINKITPIGSTHPEED